MPPLHPPAIPAAAATRCCRRTALPPSRPHAPIVARSGDAVPPAAHGTQRPERGVPHARALVLASAAATSTGRRPLPAPAHPNHGTVRNLLRHSAPSLVLPVLPAAAPNAPPYILPLALFFFAHTLPPPSSSSSFCPPHSFFPAWTRTGGDRRRSWPRRWRRSRPLPPPPLPPSALLPPPRPPPSLPPPLPGRLA